MFDDPPATCVFESMRNRKARALAEKCHPSAIDAIENRWTPLQVETVCVVSVRNSKPRNYGRKLNLFGFLGIAITLL